MLKSVLVGIFVAFVVWIWLFLAFLFGSKDFFNNYEARATFAIAYCMACPIIGSFSAIGTHEYIRK